LGRKVTDTRRRSVLPLASARPARALGWITTRARPGRVAVAAPVPYRVLLVVLAAAARAVLAARSSAVIAERTLNGERVLALAVNFPASGAFSSRVIVPPRPTVVRISEKRLLGAGVDVLSGVGVNVLTGGGLWVVGAPSTRWVSDAWLEVKSGIGPVSSL
jgi:hypothetical protein